MIPDAKTEAGSDRGGFLSYAGEWHALTVGLSVGLAGGVTGDYEVVATLLLVTFGFKPASKLKNIGKKDMGESVAGELKREPWYAGGGAIVGTVLGTSAGLFA